MYQKIKDEKSDKTDHKQEGEDEKLAQSEFKIDETQSSQVVKVVAGVLGAV